MVDAMRGAIETPGGDANGAAKVAPTKGVGIVKCPTCNEELAETGEVVRDKSAMGYHYECTNCGRQFGAWPVDWKHEREDERAVS